MTSSQKLPSSNKWLHIQWKIGLWQCPNLPLREGTWKSSVQVFTSSILHAAWAYSVMLGHITVCTLCYTVEYLISQCLFTEQLDETWTILFLSLVKYGMHGFPKFEFLLRQILTSQPNCGKLLSAFLRIGCWSIYCPVRADVLDKDLFSRDLSFLLIITQ